MLDICRETINKRVRNENQTKVSTHLHSVLKWQDQIENLKHQKEIDTDFSSTNSTSRIEERSISPLEKQKGGFSALANILSSKPPTSFIPTTNHPNPKYKTELCKNYDIYGYCKWGENCFFAHGRTELKSKTLTNHFYKTKICKHYHKGGFCPYTSRCQYFHFKTYQIYQELLDSFENKINYRFSETTDKLDKILFKFERSQPRLDIFKGLATGDNQKSLHEKFADNDF